MSSSVCLFICLLAYLRNHSPNIQQIFSACYLWPWPWPTWSVGGQNWVIGSPGQWVIWVILHVRVTRSPGHHFDPV